VCNIRPWRRSGSSTGPVDIVRGILVAHSSGVALNRIAKDVDPHHSVG
jgi:hypothetical protein